MGHVTSPPWDMCMYDRERQRGRRPVFVCGKKGIFSHMLGCRYMNMSAYIEGHMHVEMLHVLKHRSTRRQHPVKNRNKPEHHSSCFNYGVLCKSNWVERRAPASYFCSKNALSKVMRTVFEVAPAGKYSRRLCVPSPKKSLFSSNCCFPKSCSLTVLHRVWQKQRGEGRKWGRDGMKGWEGRKEGGRKTEGEVESHRLNVNIVTFQGSAACRSFSPSLPVLWHRLQCREHCSSLLH